MRCTLVHALQRFVQASRAASAACRAGAASASLLGLALYALLLI